MSDHRFACYWCGHMRTWSRCGGCVRVVVEIHPRSALYALVRGASS